MKYIDKTLHKDDGEKIVSEFLRCIYKRLGTYPEELYKNFGQEIDDNHDHRIFRERLQTDVLELEQNGLCCYCLRKLSGCKTKTIEHLICNHTQTIQDFNKYLSRRTVLNELAFSKDFTSGNNPQYPPYPHSVAYQNLVVSCDGDLFNESNRATSCNLKRRNKFLQPLPLYEDIQTKFIYHSNGMAEWLDNSNQTNKESVVSILGLNNAVLKMIRRIWFYVADHKINIHGVSRENLIYEMYGNWVVGPDFSSKDYRMLFNFKLDKYWNLFLQYDAFAKIKHV